MSVKTNNIYGKIAVSNGTIAKFIAHVAMDCYGIVEFVPHSIIDSISSSIKKGNGVKGIKIQTSGDRISIDVCVVVKYGVSIKAVAEALKESLKYKVERFTGMLVDTVNVNISGVKL